MRPLSEPQICREVIYRNFNTKMSSRQIFKAYFGLSLRLSKAGLDFKIRGKYIKKNVIESESTKIQPPDRHAPKIVSKKNNTF